MRFAFYSIEGTSLAYWSRVQDEGHEVLVYIKEAGPKRNGDGIVPKTNNLAQWQAWGLSDPSTIFVFDLTGAGELADSLRKRGRLVIGGGKFMDKLEGKRAWAEGICQQLGMKVPPHEEFENISAAIQRAKSISGEWVFKTDKYLKASATYLASSPEDMVRYLEGLRNEFGEGGKCLLQQKIPGVALSTAAWWNGKTFLTPYEGTIEHKKFMNNDVGPNTGCSFNVVYMDPDPEIAKALQWRALDAFFRAQQAPPGLYDINSLVSQESGSWGDAGQAFFLEFTPRFGYDSEPTAQALLTMDLSEFFYKLATQTLTEAPFTLDEQALSIRISVPPYPTEENLVPAGKGTCVGVPVEGCNSVWNGRFVGYGLRMNDQGDYEVSDVSGLVGLSVSTGLSTTAMNRTALSYIKKLQAPNKQYRTDAAEKILADAKALAKLGFKTPVKE